MLEPCPTYRSAPTSFGCLFAYFEGAGSELHSIIMPTWILMLVLQTEGLKRDLALWSSGLFPFFEYAATSVKVRIICLRYCFAF